MFDSEGVLELPFPVFEGGFTPWENQEEDHLDLLSSFEPPQHHFQSHEPVNSNNSGSDEPSNQPPVSAVDDRKQRRMISNRESARRSRMRKQRHLEDLRNQVNRLRLENRGLSDRLRNVTDHCHLIRRDNDRLRWESITLRQRLSDIRRILMLRQLQAQQHLLLSSPLPCNHSLSSLYEVNEQQHPLLNCLITPPIS